MPFGLAKYFINNFRNEIEISKKMVYDISEKILNEFKILFEDGLNNNINKWMDDKSKHSALEKTKLIKLYISHHETIFNVTFLEELYKVY